MIEYVRKDKLLELSYWHGKRPDVGNPYGDGTAAVDVTDIEDMPCEDVAPVKHGYWKGSFFSVECSECGNIYSNLGFSAYCPNCGAVMSFDNQEKKRYSPMGQEDVWA